MEGISNKVEFESVIGYMHDVDLADGSFNAGVDVYRQERM